MYWKSSFTSLWSTEEYFKTVTSQFLGYKLDVLFFGSRMVSAGKFFASNLNILESELTMLITTFKSYFRFDAGPAPLG
jgi:hypothetical protein